MGNLNSLDVLHRAYAHAQYVALRYFDELCAPAHELHFECWEQRWPTTACGHGGIAGQAFTDAMTVCVLRAPYCAVYFAGKFAYLLGPTDDLVASERLSEDLKERCLVSVGNRDRYAALHADERRNLGAQKGEG